MQMNIPITVHFPNMGKSDILLFMKRMNLKETCEYLSISEATGRNWVRQGRLKPLRNEEHHRIYFDAAYVRKVKNKLLEDGKLIARRNKMAISSHAIYFDYLSCDTDTLRQLQQIVDNDKINSSPLIPTIAYYARQFFLQQNNLEQYETLIEELLAVDSGASRMTFCDHSKTNQSSSFGLHSMNSCSTNADSASSDFFDPHHLDTHHLDISDDSFYPELSFCPYEDLLGFLYISLTRLDKRKKGGIYYTPSTLARRLIEHAFKYADTPSACFDPSCGTGNFLLMLHSHIKNGTLLCGQDTDPVAVAIARINIALNYPGIGLAALHENIRTADSLKQFPVCKDMLILGNPPWGAKLSDTKEDSSSLFVQNAVLHQAEQGIISFILPASLLTTRSHHKMRNFLMQQTQIVSVDYLEQSFSAVNCPAVILTLKKNSRQPGIIKCDVLAKSGHYTIHDRYIPINTGGDLWMLHADDPSYELFQKLNHMDNTAFLKGAADFALGIVTGDNKRFIIPADRISNADGTTDANAATGTDTTTDTSAIAEPVIRGRNLSRYGVHGPYDRIIYTPKTFQQCAPEHYYRAEEKILYRFIGKRPVFAYDNSGCLTLNSCNILIPHIKGLDTKYILAVLNSDVAAFFWQTGFASVKLLRSHIEALPIPMANEDEQAKIIALVDKLMTDGQNNDIIQGSTESAGLKKMEINMQLEDRIARLYGLTDSERSIINRGKNY